MSLLSGASIFVTGGTGSFGKAFLREVLDHHDPRRVVVFSRDELKQYELRQHFPDESRLRWFIGDIRDRARLERWAGEVGWEALLNRAGTTFRKLPEADRQNLDQAKAIALMLAQPSMIKRPVLDVGGELIVGFKPDRYAAAFGR